MRRIREVAGHARERQADWLNGFAIEDITDESGVVKAIGKSLADVYIGKEISRNAITIKLAGAHVGVRACIGGRDQFIETQHVHSNAWAADAQAERLRIVHDFTWFI